MLKPQFMLLFDLVFRPIRFLQYLLEGSFSLKEAILNATITELRPISRCDAIEIAQVKGIKPRNGTRFINGGAIDLIEICHAGVTEREDGFIRINHRYRDEHRRLNDWMIGDTISIFYCRTRRIRNSLVYTLVYNHDSGVIATALDNTICLSIDLEGGRVSITDCPFRHIQILMRVIDNLYQQDLLQRGQLPRSGGQFHYIIANDRSSLGCLVFAFYAFLIFLIANVVHNAELFKAR